jgi:hypothetical protein
MHFRTSVPQLLSFAMDRAFSASSFAVPAKDTACAGGPGMLFDREYRFWRSNRFVLAICLVRLV